MLLKDRILKAKREMHRKNLRPKQLLLSNEAFDELNREMADRGFYPLGFKTFYGLEIVILPKMRGFAVSE